VRPVGLIANPAAGKDIRRLVAHASTFDNLQKVNIARRVLLGLAAAGTDRVWCMPDAFGIAQRAVRHLDGAPITTLLDFEPTFGDADSTCAAVRLRELGAGCIVTLGGDGTNRAVAKGCGQVPLVAISTGTNNVFPQMMEGTIAGLAAGAVASDRLDLAVVTRPTLCLEILRDGQPVDLALIDVAVCSDRFVGARAVWDPAAIRQIVSTAARSDVLGLSSVGGFLPGIDLQAGEALALEIGPGGQRVQAPVAPGLVCALDVASHRRLGIGELVEVVSTSGVLALDGERELPLRPGERLQVRVSDRGPRVVAVGMALRQAVERGVFAAAASGNRGHQAGRQPDAMVT
jgi:predicted polyphosphate/ATP-dependent NAD kinase